MARVVIQRRVVPEQLHQVTSPRDDALVAERLRDDAGGGDPVDRSSAGNSAVLTFEGTSGPFSTWVRTVRIDGDMITQEIEYSSPLGPWRPLFVLPLRALVRRDTRRSSSPWWMPPDRLDARATRSLAAACTLAVIGGFLTGLLSQVLTFMAGEFHVDIIGQTRVLLVVRLGTLLTIAGTVLADRLGRRPVVLGSYLIGAVTAAATAVAPGLGAAVGLQLLSRSIALAGVVLLPVIAAEELPAGSRAWATGVLAMAGGLGVGFVLFALPLADVARPWSWRLIYGLAVLTIPATVWAGRALPETRRYEVLNRQERAGPSAPISRARLATLGFALVLINLFVTPVSQLQNQFLREARGFSSTRISLFIIMTSLLAGATIVIGGELADRRSRHLTATIGLLGLTIGNALMFSTRGWPMWAFSTVGSAVGALVIPSIGVLNAELFPTSRRGSASGVLNTAAVGGAVVGLLVAGELIDRWGFGPTMWLLGVGPILVILLLRGLPETARIPLEDLNPGDVSIDEQEPDGTRVDEQ